MTSRDELQRLAILAKDGITRPQGLADLWDELTSGRALVVHSFFTEQHYFLILAARDTAYSDPVRHRMRVLQAVLLEGDNKSVAYDLDVSPSTVSQSATLALRQMGLDATAGRAPVLVALAALAARRADGRRQETCATFVHDGRPYRAVWALRPEQRLARVLTSAERDVVRGLIEGRAHREIARHRGTSERTVANQISAVFRRLGVSGRGRLLQYVIGLGTHSAPESARNVPSS